jgi:lysophospholipase L1-like esterase
MKRFGISNALRLTGLFCLMIWVAGCASKNDVGSTSTMPQPTPAVWVTAWGNSPENAEQSASNPGGSEQSFRMLFYPTVSGTKERLHFSNFFGTGPVTIGAARLSISPDGSAAIDSTHDVGVTFGGGSTSITIPAGLTIMSDPVTLTYSFGQRLAVSMYVKGNFAALTQHDSQVTTNYQTPMGAGDMTADAEGISFSQPNTEWYLLSGMDVFGSYQGTVVLFGSSSIDGHNSNTGDTNSYPTANPVVAGQDDDRPSDWLARQLNTAGYQVGVLNAGVLGDAAGPNSGDAPTTVQDGIDRMNRDVIHQTNVKAVVIYLGSIDIRSSDCKSAGDVEGYLTQLVAMGAAAQLRVIVATLPPAAFCSNQASPNYGPFPTAADPYAGEGNPPTNGGMVQRNLVNAWIRSTAITLPGVVGIADFDKALADPAHPDFLIPNLNSGDNFHPNGVGYGVQSSAIPLNLLLAPATN